MTPVTPTLPASAHPPRDIDMSPLRQAATELEAAFLTEMLKSAGFGKSRESMGGGAGEDQYSSLLVRAQADHIAQSGGIGLAESLFNALKDAHHDG